MLNFSGKLALVCGASQGMGYATAKLLAENGASLICISRNSEKLENAISKLKNSSRHRVYSVDLSDLDFIEKFLSLLTKEKLEPDILINNSAGPASSKALGLNRKELDQPYTQHLVASNLLTQALIKPMIEKNYGRIVNIVSISGKVPSDNIASSNIIRSSMLAWAKSLSNEVADKGVTVNSVLPGYTSTERLEEVISSRASNNKVSEDSIKEKIMSKIPMKRFASADEIAAAVCFLASDQASYITGTALQVDGGYIPTVF